MKKFISIIFTLFILALLYSCTSTTDTEPSLSEDEINKKISQHLQKFTIEQKVGQMMMPEYNSVSAQEIKTYNIGSVIFGAGQHPNANHIVWANRYNNLQRAALSSPTAIPLLFGIDAVHGHNAVRGATLFPHLIGLGAANDPELMEKIGYITAKEMARTGINWNFSPSVAVVQNVQWGRTYESLGEHPELQSALTYNYVKGLQKENRLATAKHFLGDGGTNLRDNSGGPWSIDQGNVSISYEDLYDIHLPGYLEAIKADVGAIMVSYSSFQGIKMHENIELITGLLKETLEFKGIVVSDYDGIKQIPNKNYYHQLVAAVNAGIDVLMEPHTWKEAHGHIVNAVKKGDIPLERIDDAVSRILRIKYKLGLFDNPLVKIDGRPLSTEEHRLVAREAVRKSLVLLKNENNLLPLSKTSNVLLLGPGIDNLALQNGGWTVRWQGAESGDVIEGTTIREAFQEVSEGRVYTDLNDASKADVVVLVLAETPYAEGWGDNGYLDICFGLENQGSYTAHPDNLQAIEDALATRLPIVVILLAGRPMIVTDFIDDWDSFVMAWLPGSEGGLGIADCIFGDYDFTGKLPVTWPKTRFQLGETVLKENYNEKDYLFPYGYGLSYK